MTVNDQTKQRVIGTVVLLALALIFLPIIFNGDGSYQRTINSRIPSIPVITEMPDPVPQRPVIEADTMPEPVIDQTPATLLPDTDQPGIENREVAQSSSAGSSPETTPEPAAKPQLDANGLPIAWSVRLGTFSNAANAQKLTADLLASGYRAYTREYLDEQNTMTMVLVGPQVERDKAEQLQAQLQAEFQLSGLIVRYEIDSLD